MKYIKYTLEALQPIIINEIRSKAKTQKTLAYIPGSSVRGAFVSVFLRDRGERDETELAKILDNVVFSNAYISDSGKTFIPTPKSFQGDKHSVRNKDFSNVINSIIIDSRTQRATDPEGKFQPEPLARKYTFYSPDSSMISKPETELSRRVSINTPQDENGALFYTEALKSGQVFSGYIQYPDELEDLVAGTKSKMELPSFGAYINSGYGGCDIRFDEQPVDEIKVDTIGNAPSGSLYIYCLSDVISYSADGKCISRIDESTLENELGLTGVSLESSILTQKLSLGYNNKMGAAYPRETAIAAGSVFKYSYSGSVDHEKIIALFEKGIGKRKQEGFGKVLLNPEFLLKGNLKLEAGGAKE